MIMLIQLRTNAPRFVFLESQLFDYVQFSLRTHAPRSLLTEINGLERKIETIDGIRLAGQINSTNTQDLRTYLLELAYFETEDY
jgi:hypothetical protein